MTTMSSASLHPSRIMERGLCDLGMSAVINEHVFPALLAQASRVVNGFGLGKIVIDAFVAYVRKLNQAGVASGHAEDYARAGRAVMLELSERYLDICGAMTGNGSVIPDATEFWRRYEQMRAGNK